MIPAFTYLKDIIRRESRFIVFCDKWVKLRLVCRHYGKTSR